MKIRYPEIGICGLSCRLCPSHHTNAASRCAGCKSPGRMSVGCPFITCAVKNRNIEFCWDCATNETCERWRKHRETGKEFDSFKCYRTLEKDIAFIRKNGAAAFQKSQKTREKLLRTMLSEFNEGRSKSYYCIAATVLGTDEIAAALSKARRDMKEREIAEKSKYLHILLDEIARKKKYPLKLRRWKD